MRRCQWITALPVLLLLSACGQGTPSTESGEGEASIDLSEWMHARRIEGRDIRMLGLEITREGRPASGLLVMEDAEGKEQTTLAGPGVIQIPEAAISAAGKTTLRLANGSGYAFNLYAVETIEQSSGPDIFRFYQGGQTGVQLSGGAIDLSIPVAAVPHGSLEGRTLLLEDEGEPIMGLHDGATVLTDHEIGFTWPPVPNDELGRINYPELPAGRDFTLCLHWRGQQKCLESLYNVDAGDTVTLGGVTTLNGEEDDANVRMAVSAVTGQGEEIVAGDAFELVVEALEGESLNPLPAFQATVPIAYELQGFADGACDNSRALKPGEAPEAVAFEESDRGSARRNAAISYVGDVIIRATYGSEVINPIERTILPKIYFDLTYRSDLSTGLFIVYDVRARQLARDGLPADYVNGTVTAMIEDETGAPAIGLSGTVSTDLVNGQGQIAIDFSSANTANHDYVTRVDYESVFSCRSRTPYIDFANGVIPAP